MSHKNYIKMIVPYLDNTLDAARRKKLEEHVKDCPSCREELRAMQNLTADMKKPLPEEMDREAFRQILASTRNAFFRHRREKEQKMDHLPAVITVFSIILFVLSSLFSFRLLTSGISPFRALVAFTLIGSQITGIMFFMLVFSLKKRFANHINGFVSNPKKTF